MTKRLFIVNIWVWVIVVLSWLLLSVHSEAHGHHVLDAGLQLVVLLHGRHSFGGPRQDEVALLKADEFANVTDEIWNGEDHIGGAAALSQLVVDLEPQLHVARVGDALLGDELADRTGRVESLGQRPGETFGLAVVLDVPGRHVQTQSVARYMVHGVGLRDGRAPLADDHPQLHFMVHVVGVDGNQNGGALRDVGGWRLQEENRCSWNSVLQLFGVLCIVSPDANDLPAPLPKPGYIPRCHRGPNVEV